MIVSEEVMAAVAAEVLEFPQARRYSQAMKDKKIRGHFGASIAIITAIWNEIEASVDAPGAMPKHLLWALVFLKIYASEEVHCRLVGWTDSDTFRKWSWYFVEKIADLKDTIIVFDNRFQLYDSSTHCLMSLDGTDCPINEPWPFDKKWYSHKFNGPALKYELGVCIRTGHIVWLNGPFPASVSDVKIFRDTLANLLADDEGCEVDGVYGGHPKLKAPEVRTSREDGKQKSIVRGRHENINGRLKIYNVLNIPFRHLQPRHEMMHKHSLCFYAVAVITQMKLSIGGEELYDVAYDVTYY